MKGKTMRQSSVVQLIAGALLVAFLAGCAGTPDRGAELTASAGEPIKLYEPWVQHAQNQDGAATPGRGGEPGAGARQPMKLYEPWVQFAQNQDDGDFEDLFPADDTELEEDFDPLETLNRFIFAFNEMLDVIILQPAAATYRFLLPELVQDGIRNFVRNLEEPVIFINKLWQGRDEEASDTLARFGINSTLGLAGLFDVAKSFGLEYSDADFGQTLGFYGAGPGPYLVLPLFGPSSARDGIGKGVDALLDPWPHVLTAAGVGSNDRLRIAISRRAASGVDKRARNIENIEELKRDSVDFYARIRSLYLQDRRNFIDEAKQGQGPADEAGD